MEWFVVRMIDEHQELAERIKKLHDFLNSDDLALKVSKKEISLMRIQLNCMMSYALVLEERIEMHVDMNEEGK